MEKRLSVGTRRLAGAIAGFTLGLYASVAGATTLQEVAKTLNIDASQISVSGISSGGFMAHQFHVAHSTNLMGVGVVAGGPYDCADGTITGAITKCSKFMALQCDAPMTGLSASLMGLCNSPYTGPTTDQEARDVAKQSFTVANANSSAGVLSPLAGMKGDRVYLFTGLNDEIVPYGVMNALFHFYADTNMANVGDGNVVLNRQFPAHHTMVTDNFYKATERYVGACNRTGSMYGDPYIGDCKTQAGSIDAASACSCSESPGSVCPTSAEAQAKCTIQPGQDNPFRQAWPDQSTCETNVRQDICRSAHDVDLAGAILMKIYPDIAAASRQSLLSPTETANLNGLSTRLARTLNSKLVQFSQAQLIKQKFAVQDAGAWASFADNGYVYIPETCKSGASCRLHVAFHGCKQGGDNDPPYGNVFSRFAGYNEWARNNHMVVLYPQVQAENSWPINPQGCWDWWGMLYTGPDYATVNGKQIKAVAQMINTLIGKNLFMVPVQQVSNP